MKGCLQTIGTIAFIVIIIIIGFTTYDSLTEKPPTPAPELEPTTTPPELPAPTVQLPETINEESLSTELLTRDYSWTYKGEWNWQVKIPLSLYEYYQKIPRPPTNDYSVYVTHPLDDPYIDLLVEKIKKAAQQKGYTEGHISRIGG